MKAGRLYKEIKGAEVMFGEPLAGHTSLNIGGRAEIFARPVDAESLSRLLGCAAGLPVILMGGGTNLLVADGDIKALVISTGDMRGIEICGGREDGGAIISVAAGEPLKKVLAFCLQNGLSGLEPLAGIPGSIGGAVAGNAGAHGLQIGALVRSALVVDLSASATVKKVSNEDLGFRYRGSSARGLITNVEIALKKGEPQEIKKLMVRNFELKKKTQPLAARSAGCVFKNPEGFSAGRLIDAAGFKGARVGDIEVSRMHANFFINKGKGTAADFTGLMGKVRDGVFKRSGVSLEPEIRMYLGDKNAGN